MAGVAKVVTIIGSSPESFAKAADAAVQEAAKTLRGIHGAHVTSMSAVVENDQHQRVPDDGRHRVRASSARARVLVRAAPGRSRGG